MTFLPHPRVMLPVLIAIIFVLLDSNFLLTGNLYALGQIWSIIALITLGLACTMICGEFDLSVGPTVALSGIIMIKTGETSILTGVTLALGAGLIIGLFNGLGTILLRVPSLLLTLGTMIVVGGVALGAEGGQIVTYTNFDASDRLDAPILHILSLRSLIAIIAIAVLVFILGYTRIGRDIYATGSNRNAALMSGARVDVSIVVAFVISGMLAALAGALTSISLATASAQYGSNSLIQAVTAAIVGGVALRGGIGHPVSIGIGVLTMAMLNNGLSMIGASGAMVLFANGVVLLAVVLSGGGLKQILGSAFSPEHQSNEP